MPRMALVGDLDLDETLGALIDPLGASDIPPAVEPTRRWLELAELLRVEIVGEGKQLPPDAALLRLAREIAATMDRLLAEQVAPEDLLGEAVLHEVRSEEHTSELQSLMRISYAVFCLKKKTETR